MKNFYEQEKQSIYTYLTILQNRMTDATFLFGTVSLTVIVILYLYVFIGQLFEAKKFHLIHETGFGIILGMIAGLIFFYAFPTQLARLADFNQEVFFYFLLPTIIFSGGYNLNKKRFFQNFFYVVIYGVFGTILQFILMTLFTKFFNDLGLIRLTENYDDVINLNLYQIMIYSATMSASDSVAALTMIKSEQYPKLFSVVFGEGMINDAVAIIIFTSVGKMTSSSGDDFIFHWYTAFELLGSFLLEFTGSSLVGLFIGLGTTWTFKKARFLTHSCMAETLMVLYMGFFSFNACYMVDLSGVLSALVCGVVLAHYNFYNVSPLGKVTSQVTINSIALISESFIYIYLGLSIWIINPLNSQFVYYTSWTFLIQQFLVIIFARIATIASISLLSILVIGRKKWRLSVWEVGIVCFAGMIRGSVAYALIQSLVFSKDNTAQAQQVQIIQTTVLFLVVISTVLFGGMMPCFISVSLQQAEKNQGRLGSVRDTLLGRQSGIGESNQSKNYRSKIQMWIRRLDERVMKPFFIYNYAQRKTEIDKLKRHRNVSNNMEQSQFGRMTLITPHQSSDLRASQLVEQKLQSSNNQQDVWNRQSLTKSRVIIRSSMNSKFGGNQDIDLCIDVPIFLEDIQEDMNEPEVLLENEQEMQIEDEEEEEEQPYQRSKKRNSSIQ